MFTGIDHLVIAVGDPEAAAVELERAAGLRAADGGRHEALGTFNRLVWLGDAYLELIGVWDPNLAAASWIGRPTLEALAHGGGLATYALASDGLTADIVHLRAAGGTWDGPAVGVRERPDGRIVRWWLATPPGLGPDEPPFLIQHDPEGAEWSAADRAARATEVHPIGSSVRLEALELPVEPLRVVKDRYLRALGLVFRPSLVGRGARETSVGPHAIRLRPAAAALVDAGATIARVPTIRLVAPGCEARVVDALGLRFIIRG